jgi:hypothetical protein
MRKVTLVFIFAVVFIGCKKETIITTYQIKNTNTLAIDQQLPGYDGTLWDVKIESVDENQNYTILDTIHEFKPGAITTIKVINSKKIYVDFFLKPIAVNWGYWYTITKDITNSDGFTLHAGDKVRLETGANPCDYYYYTGDVEITNIGSNNIFSVNSNVFSKLGGVRLPLSGYFN